MATGKDDRCVRERKITEAPPNKFTLNRPAWYLRLKDRRQNTTEKEDQCGCRVEEKMTEKGDQIAHKLKQNAHLL